MPLIDWKESFSVGHPDLDADHRNLVDLINTLHEAWRTGEDRDVLHGIFGELLMYTDYHFRREEEMLTARRYDRLDDQTREHGRLRDSVQAFRTRHLTDRTPVLTTEVEDFLKSWMMSHILEEDMRYRRLFDAPPA